MKKRVLGPSKLEVSALGFGCMGMSQSFGPNPGDRGQMIDLLRTAVDRGVTFFDTAEVYGPFVNEELVGEALAPVRDQVVIATKFGFAFDDRRPAVRPVQPARAHPAGSGRVAAAARHRPHRPAVPAPRRPAGTDRGRGRDGQGPDRGRQGPPLWPVRGRRRTIRRAHAVQPVTALQSEYSLFWREPEDEIIPVLEELGIGLVPFSPLGRGFLTGRIDQATQFGEGDIRANLPRFTAEARAANQAVVDLLARIADGKNATPAQIALAWLLAQKPWIVPIPGTRRLERLDENLGAVQVELTTGDLDAIDTAAAQIQVVGDRYPEAMQRMIDR